MARGPHNPELNGLGPVSGSAHKAPLLVVKHTPLQGVAYIVTKGSDAA